MFSKPTPRSSSSTTPVAAALPTLSAADAQATRRAGPKVASLIAEDMTIEGGIAGDGEFHVDGTVKGDIKVGRLTIGETGVVEGSVVAEAVECRGKIVGTLNAKQVRLYGSAYVDGDITHEQLAMETGAFFQGRSLKFQRPAPAAPKPQVALTAPPTVTAPADVKPADVTPLEVKPAG